MNDLQAFVEIESNSKYKYEWKDNQLILDRPLNQFIPASYGFIPRTLCEDGDPLDVFIITKWPIKANTSVKIEIIGMFECKDNGQNDPKLIAQLKDEPSINSWFNEINKIETYLKTYKDGFEVLEYVSKDDALEELFRSFESFESVKQVDMTKT